MASPTIQLNSPLLTLIIDAHECRDVATADVVGAYLMADINDFVLVKIREESVDIICLVNLKLTQSVSYKKCNKVLYLQLAKALYECMQSALLCYETFKGCLEELGFKLIYNITHVWPTKQSKAKNVPYAGT